ncbi:MAG: N-acetylmuramidase family protein, partial [bacterium]
MDFRGAARPLTQGDIARAAKLLRVPEAVIWALRKVEANGKAFSDGRPIIAWEAHVFYKQLPQSKRARAVAARLAHSRWGVIGYKLRQSSRYQQLHNAMAIDLEAALCSASWGAFQIMGFNFKRCGYGSVQAFVQAMTESEGEQLMACCQFIRADKAMHKALREGDWAGFARRYNGPAYAKHDYDGRLVKWVAHFSAKGSAKRLETEVARRADPKDPDGAKRESREAVKDAGRVSVGIT